MHSPRSTPAPGSESPGLQQELTFGQMFRIMNDLHATLRERDSALAGLERAHNEALHLLALAAEYRDGDTGTHVVRVGALSGIVARACGMDIAYCNQLRQAAPMHDIGKIGVPDNVLKKPGTLTPSEWALMREHANIGAKILEDGKAPVFQLAAEVARSHHEQFDGSGYPNGLRAEAIPLSGRIVALVDVYDALTMDRCYRKAFTPEQAITMIEKKVGQHFDPKVFETFAGVLREIADVTCYINRNHVTLVDLAKLPLA
ncbi:MAG: HD domain-containing protein [Betaproteobacteria bacterium]|nr:HD domain-containing protein [Betaproteobacteria bacterium]